MIRCEWSMCQEKEDRIPEDAIVAVVHDGADHSHTLHLRCALLFRIQQRCKEQRHLN